MINVWRKRFGEAYKKYRKLGWKTTIPMLIVIIGWVMGRVLTGWINPQTASERIDMMTGLAQVIGGGALLFGLLFTYKGLVNSRETLEHSQTSQLNERFFKAVEQLGNDSPVVRAGALYALGMLAKDSNQHYQQAMDIVVQYVRGKVETEVSSESNTTPSVDTDIQAALHVIG